eukprot:TRINITY_DN7801_c0_g1_i1.p1 TRINITY_DN7801_c0_g1~~TRINITY_DN7801_c0_g1_i1.p1  ORF type:complete len:343 (+),score=59.80 TRINITY_DN7801_c0_g1_i1:31-1059(+)
MTEEQEERAAKRRKTDKSPSVSPVRMQSSSPDRIPSPSRWRKRRRFSVSAEADMGPSGVPPLPPQALSKKKVPLGSEVIQRVMKALRNVFLCAHLDSEQLRSIVECMEEFRVSAGSDVVVEGDEGDYFYLIDSGVFHVFKTPNRVKVFEYNNRGSFGELALMYNCPRAATVHAITDGVLFRVDRATFRHIIVSSQIQKRTLYESFLSNVQIFKKLNHSELAQVLDCVYEKTFSDGELVIQQGEQGDRFYLIAEGSAKAVKHESNGSGVVGLMRKGEFFGERALITSEPRACDVVAVGNLKVVCMDRQQFERLLGPCREILQRRISQYDALNQEHNKSAVTLT